MLSDDEDTLEALNDGSIHYVGRPFSKKEVAKRFDLAKTFRNLRLSYVMGTMRLWTPKFYVDVQNLCELRSQYLLTDMIDVEPRPMIQFVKRLGLKGLVGAEVGVSTGVNAKSICETLDVSCLHLVDPYLPYFENGMVRTLQGVAGDMAISLLRGKPVVWHIKLSLDAAKEIEGMLDFCYIDACHEYEAVKEDLAAWYPKVKVGGVIGGHDFIFSSGGGGGVVKAVTEFAYVNKLKLQSCFPDWWIVK